MDLEYQESLSQLSHKLVLDSTHHHPPLNSLTAGPFISKTSSQNVLSNESPLSRPLLSAKYNPSHVPQFQNNVVWPQHISDLPALATHPVLSYSSFFESLHSRERSPSHKPLSYDELWTSNIFLTCSSASSMLDQICAQTPPRNSSLHVAFDLDISDSSSWSGDLSTAMNSSFRV